MSTADKINELLERGVDQVIVRDSLSKKLRSGARLRVKLGIDATASRLHLGHAVVLRKLRQFQELDHQVILLVGDFTARIGDPSDRLSARKPLTDGEITENIKTYQEQVGQIIDLAKAEFRYNSEWHQNMDFAELFRLLSYFSVNQMLERDMFQKRMKLGKPLWVHELTYPILQGYDSVALRADVELGGTDQTFNVLAAREIQPRYDQVPQDILTVPLLEGTDGTEKMSKSVGNTIDLLDTPQDMYGKLMSIPDRLIVKYFTLLTDVTLSDIAATEKSMAGGSNPRDAKATLAATIVGTFHGSAAATGAAAEFDRMFKQKLAPTAMPEYRLKKAGTFGILDVLLETKLAPSRSEARRLVEQGGVTVDGIAVAGWKDTVNVKAGTVIKAGKRKFTRVV
ncbi:MAG: tyrosine--tRNA ligase [Patescibacteria group bacterium]